MLTSVVENVLFMSVNVLIINVCIILRVVFREVRGKIPSMNMLENVVKKLKV